MRRYMLAMIAAGVGALVLVTPGAGQDVGDFGEQRADGAEGVERTDEGGSGELPLPGWVAPERSARFEEGIDFLHPAALFLLQQYPGEPPYVVDSLGLGVKKRYFELRSVLEFDMWALPEQFDSIKLKMWVQNMEPGDPVEAMEFYDFVGNAQEEAEDWDAGELYWTHDYPYPDLYRRVLILDLTDLAEFYIQEGHRYLGLRLSTPDDSIYFRIGKTMAFDLPNPLLIIRGPESSTSLEDYLSFGECVVGPDTFIDGDCPVFWDFDDDRDVDLADFAQFQALFED